MQSSLIETMRREWPDPPWHRGGLVVAISGGPDSVALLHGLLELGMPAEQCTLAHMDHGLRGDASDGDRHFVERLALSLGLRCVIKRLVACTDTNSVAAATIGQELHGRASEAVLRRHRHAFLKETAVEQGAAWIATGHHADDCVETFLHHLLRGSGPLGLSSIAPTRTLMPGLQLVRPLLAVCRTDILQFLDARGLSYRTDASNADREYTRNRIRHELLPWLREFSRTPNLDHRLWNAAQMIREEHIVIEALAAEWLAALGCTSESAFVELPAAKCHDTSWVVVRQALVSIWHVRGWQLGAVTAKHWDRLRRLIEASRSDPHPKRLQLPGGIQVTMRQQRLRLERIATSHSP